MIRKIVRIDEEKCNGCGVCVDACHEGALQMINGKAKLVSESYCDGLGDCLPECPAGAITIEEREADAFDEEAVKQNMKKEQANQNTECGCPGSRAISLKMNRKNQSAPAKEPAVSQLGQWPCQIKLVPVNAPYFNNAHLLIAADCAAFAYANIHNDFMKNKITLIGCPKLDDVDYSTKLAEIIKRNDIQSVTVLRMSVPCCGGLAYSVKQALIQSGKMIPWRIVVIDTDGTILDA